MKANGARFYGMHNNGLLNGEGTATFIDGRKYEGEWKNGKP